MGVDALTEGYQRNNGSGGFQNSKCHLELRLNGIDVLLKACISMFASLSLHVQQTNVAVTNHRRQFLFNVVKEFSDACEDDDFDEKSIVLVAAIYTKPHGFRQ